VTIGGSIALIVTGAILRYAVNWSSAHVNVPLIGLILMVGGAIGLIISLVFLMRRRTSAPSEEVYQQRRYTEAPGRTLSLRIVTPSLRAAPPSAGLTMRSAARARSCRTGSVYAPGSSANTRYLKGSSCRWRSSAGGVRE
jgi:hypothetical protein